MNITTKVASCFGGAMWSRIDGWLILSRPAALNARHLIRWSRPELMLMRVTFPRHACHVPSAEELCWLSP